MTRKLWNKLLTFTLITVMLIGSATMVQAKATEEYLEELEALKDLILNTYSGGEVTEDELFEAALDGMTSILDDYSVFYNDVEASVFLNSLSSEYVGIGVRLEIINDKAVVTEVFEGGAAYDAGVMMNDVITKVNGVEANGYDLNELVDMIVGEEGTYVTIEFMRIQELITFELERRTITVPSVVEIDLTDDQFNLPVSLQSKVKAIGVTSFMSKTDEDFIEEVDQAIADGVEYLLVDLRDNRGGYLETATNMLERMVPAGNIVSLVNKDGSGTVYASELESVPFQVVVLVNENSASASEIFAAAVKENGDGIVIGEQTYGKGVAQNIYRVGTEYLAKLTTQEFFSPDMNKINGIGVIPDVIIDNAEFVYSERRFYKSDKDDEIKNVEGMLRFLGYFNEVPDDTYTTATFDAVKAFQAATGLYPYGVCDFTTQFKLNEIYRQAIINDDEQLQYAVQWIVQDAGKN